MQPFAAFFGPVLRDRRGVAAVFLAVALVPLIGAVGLAIDSSLGYLLKTRMGKALDTAGLAAGRVALDANADEVAQQFFDANFGTSNASVTVEPVRVRARRHHALRHPLDRGRRRRRSSCGSSATTP